MLFGPFDVCYKKCKKKEEQKGRRRKKQEDGGGTRQEEGRRNTSRQSESFELALLMSSVDVCRGWRWSREVILRAASKAK